MFITDSLDPVVAGIYEDDDYDYDWYYEDYYDWYIEDND